MNCPKCGKELRGVVVNHAPTTTAGEIKNTVRCVAYCCESCSAVLGIESSPALRDAQLAEMKKQIDALAKTVQEMSVKAAARAAGRV